MSDGDNGEGSSGKGWIERFAGLVAGGPADRRELRAIIRDATERGLLDEEAMNIMFGAMQMADMQARDVMIPRAQVVCVAADAPPEEILPVIIESQHSRYPVIGDEVDDVRGILHAKDLLPQVVASGGRKLNLRDCMRPAHRIPESKRLNNLLQEFRVSRNHMAVVVDEYGHVSGVVTIEDVLEQIVGEIEDEHDIHDDSFIKQVSEGCYIVKAVTPIEQFNERFLTDFPRDEFDTIGGFVVREFGRLPEREEVIDIDKLHFKVLNADGRRIKLLQLTLEGAADSVAE